MSENKNLGTPACPAPRAAYGRADVFDMGQHDRPRTDHSYSDYKVLGRLPIGAHAETKSAKEAARAKFGPGANVFPTARFWVVYRIV